MEATGFRKAVISDITLDVAAEVAENIVLEVGQMTETVEVQANTLAVQTTESEVSQVVTISDIATLPQIARTPPDHAGGVPARRANLPASQWIVERRRLQFRARQWTAAGQQQ